MRHRLHHGVGPLVDRARESQHGGAGQDLVDPTVARADVPHHRHVGQVLGRRRVRRHEHEAAGPQEVTLVGREHEVTPLAGHAAADEHERRQSSRCSGSGRRCRGRVDDERHPHRQHEQTVLRHPVVAPQRPCSPGAVGHHPRRAREQPALELPGQTGGPGGVPRRLAHRVEHAALRVGRVERDDVRDLPQRPVRQKSRVVRVEVDHVVSAFQPVGQGARDPGGLGELVARRAQVGVVTRQQRDRCAEDAAQQVRRRHVLDVDDQVRPLRSHAPQVVVHGGVPADVLVDQESADRPPHRYQAASSALLHMPSRIGLM